MNVCQEEVPGGAVDADIVLEMEGELEVVPPVFPGMAVFREDGILEEDFQAIEVRAEAVKDDDVRGDEEEIP